MLETPGRVIAPHLLGALGFVFGDIGTSPLYAFGLAFDDDGPFPKWWKLAFRKNFSMLVLRR